MNATLMASLPRPEPPAPVAGRVPRIARLLALAHDIERRVRSGELDDFAAAARAYGLTRARVTQIVNLTLLAPAIQEEILAMEPVTEGRDRITERTLRPIVAEPEWERQRVAWSVLRATAAGVDSVSSHRADRVGEGRIIDDEEETRGRCTRSSSGQAGHVRVRSARTDRR